MNDLTSNTDCSVTRFDPIKARYNLLHYPEKDPERFLNEFFHVTNITDYLEYLFTTLFSIYFACHPDQIRDFLVKQFRFQEREAFSRNLRAYVLSTVLNNKAEFRKNSMEFLEIDMIEKEYIPKLVEFFKLFLRAHLLWQGEFDTQEECEEYTIGYSGYYFLDVAFHEFAVGKTFNLRGILRNFEQDSVEILGIQTAIVEVESFNKELYCFEIGISNYRRIKSKLKKVLDDNFSFKFTVMPIPSLNRFQCENLVQGKILGLE